MLSVGILDMGRNCYCFRLYELLLAPPNVCPRLVLLLLLVSAVLTVPRVHSSPASNSITAADDQLTAHQLDQLYRQQELTRLKQRILEGLGLTKIPDVSKMNVSREEYERMYRVYLRSVEEQRRREQEEADRIPHQSHGSPSSASVNPLERAAPPQRFYSFPHAPSSGEWRTK
ncbi:hypothetical protein B566_EDAN001181 [Ephemera danica]|nr:hypothetical protein B566_EDAN001181 [Ephemera danica]